MTTLRAVNLAVKFLLELGAIAAFAYGGANHRSGQPAVLLAIVAPAVAIVLWGIFAAPKSQRRLSRSARVPFELAVFALAVAALLAAASPVAAIIFAIAVVVNAVLLATLGQLDE